jgi:hypothetical protein
LAIDKLFVSLSPWERVGVRDEVSDLLFLFLFFFVLGTCTSNIDGFLSDIAERLTEGKNKKGGGGG